jgi:hypothetical protein
MPRIWLLALSSTIATSALLGCGSEDVDAFPTAQIGETVVVEGTVTKVDASAMPRDGDGVIRVSLESGARVEVLVPARIPLALKESGDAFRHLTKGDRIEAAGQLVRQNTLRIADTTNYLRRVGR